MQEDEARYGEESRSITNCRQCPGNLGMESKGRDQSLYQHPIAAVTNYRRCGGLKQHAFIFI